MHLSQNKNIVIQKADKCNTIVMMYKTSYVSLIEEILNDPTKLPYFIYFLVGKSIIYAADFFNQCEYQV